MNPVLTGFAGHVPASIVGKYPAAKVTHLPAWHGHMLNGTYTLDPSDPLFQRIGNAFTTRQLAAMEGTGYGGVGVNYYLADPYNEMYLKKTPHTVPPAFRPLSREETDEVPQDFYRVSTVPPPPSAAPLSSR